MSFTKDYYELNCFAFSSSKEVYKKKVMYFEMLMKKKDLTPSKTLNCFIKLSKFAAKQYNIENPSFKTQFSDKVIIKVAKDFNEQFEEERKILIDKIFLECEAICHG